MQSQKCHLCTHLRLLLDGTQILFRKVSKKHGVIPMRNECKSVVKFMLCFALHLVWVCCNAFDLSWVQNLFRISDAKRENVHHVTLTRV
mmetsp:Transcript_21318/g.62064  ORF Transcript_21318/g.62064 Transcript_21318/m.62064 type:complete len:89 (+) Transcript_21318:164-430(+)